MTAPSPLYATDGTPLVLGNRLGRGGEGAVYAVSNAPEQVAKLYHAPPPPAKAAKLAAMAALAAPDLTAVAAWPLTTVHSGAATGPLVGFAMPRISGYHELHELNAPKSRLAAFPAANWDFLVLVAANAARAFATVHAHGQVIGDVNDRNLVVAKSGVTRLIDCDSFQIQAASETFFCQVGVPTHTAPELQGTDLATTLRTANHDNFGLTVLIFQLLFLGRHPFAGRALDRDNLTITDAIGEYRFAYGATAPSRQMQPPPGAPPLTLVPAAMAAMFGLAFSRSGAITRRPSAHEWVAALDGLREHLRKCAEVPGHIFPDHLTDCPWCDLSEVNRIAFFPGDFEKAAISENDADSLWAAIARVPPPPPLPKLGTFFGPGIALSSQVAAVVGRSRIPLLAALGIVFILALLIAHFGGEYGGTLGGGTAFVCLGVIMLVNHVFDSRTERVRQSVDEALKLSAERWRRYKHEWDQLSPAKFLVKQQELARILHSYRDLQDEHGKMQRSRILAMNERQVEIYLDQHPIEGQPGISLTVMQSAMLRSYGFETAADVSSGLNDVPGIGRSLVSLLVEWRADLVNQFQPGPEHSLSDEEQQAVSRALDQRRALLRSALRNGPAELEAIRRSSMSERERLQPQIERIIREYRQAQVDHQALN